MDDDEIHATQPSDTEDKAIYLEIQEKLGYKDKRAFEACLIDIYKDDIKQLNHIRESIYNYAKDIYRVATKKRPEL